MINLTQTVLQFICLLIISIPKINAAAWPEMPFTEKSKVSIVSENMIFNGIPMKTWTLDSEESLSEVVSFYRENWENTQDSLYDEKTQDGWTYINSKQQGFLLTAKLQSILGKTQGYMGISYPENRSKNFILGNGFPLPRGSIVINDITESDPGKRNRFLLLNSEQNVPNVYRFYINKFSEDGWLSQSSSIEPTKKTAIITMNKNGDELNITIAKTGTRSQVTINMVKRSIF